MPFGTPRAFHKKFKFVVEIDGVASARFQKCSELSIELAKVEYYEGGALLPNKGMGRGTVADITLERGATDDPDLWNWMKLAIDQVSQLGAKENDVKRTLDLVQLDRDGEELRRWTVHGAWPTKFVAGDWDNEADENVIEKLTLAIDSFDKTLG
jgi:phage tail-like protein